MTGLHEALDDIAAEITPIDPPVELAMRVGHKRRHRRRIAALGAHRRRERTSRFTDQPPLTRRLKGSPCHGCTGSKPV
jgi:hypothetical protein